MSSGLNARNHDEPILPGNQIHERCAGANDATWGMDPQLGHHAVLGRLDRRSRELVVGRLQPLAYLEDLVLHLAQRLRDLVLTVMLQFEENRLGLADNLPRARYLRDNLSPPSLDIGDLPLEVQKPRAPLKSLADERGDGRRFLADDFDAP